MATKFRLTSNCPNTFIHEASKGPPATQQSICRVLGLFDYAVNSNGLLPAVEFLVASVDRSVCLFPSVCDLTDTFLGSHDYEEYRGSPQCLHLHVSDIIFSHPCSPPTYASMISALRDAVLTRQIDLSSDAVNRMLDSLLAGLQDYTTDERGDVGSWVRVACVKGLESFAETLILNAALLPDFQAYLPAAKYHELVGGILKQGVERLDNVRQQAGAQFIRLLSLPLPQVDGAEAWRIHGEQLMSDLFLRYRANSD